MGLIIKLQLLLAFTFCAINSFGAQIEWLPAPVEPGAHVITTAKDYHNKKYRFDTTKPCDEARCFQPGTVVFCSKYVYVPEGKLTHQFCHVSHYQPKGQNKKAVAADRTITMISGVSAPNKDGIVLFSHSTVSNHFFEVDLNMKPIPLPKPIDETPIPPKPKPKPIPESSESEAGIADCANCEPPLGPAGKLANEGKKAATTKPKVKVTPVSQVCNKSQTAETCHVCNCYHESRGESLSGKIAVIRTVLERMTMKRFPGAATACGVVYVPYQFSWTFDKHEDDITAKKPDEVDALKDCKRALVIAKQRGPGAAYFYNPNKAKPKWAGKMTECAEIGNHRFMVSPPKKCPANLSMLPIPQHKETVLYSISEGKIW